MAVAVVEVVVVDVQAVLVSVLDVDDGRHASVSCHWAYNADNRTLLLGWPLTSIRSIVSSDFSNSVMQPVS